MGGTINVSMDKSNKERVIQIGKCLDEDEKKDHATLLHEFHELFAWNYLDMLGIDAKIVTQHSSWTRS